MVTMANNNYFNIDYFTLDFTGHLAFFSMAQKYSTMFIEAYKVNKLLHSMINNIEFTLTVNNIDSVQKIDNILLNLESFSHSIEVYLQDKLFLKWYSYPLKYILNKVEDSNMSLQGMLGTQQALLMNHDDSIQNT